MTRKNKLLNNAIPYLLLNSLRRRFHQTLILVSQLNILSPLGSNDITSILDCEFMYILGSESEKANDHNQYFIQHVNSKSKIQVYSVLFERMWLLEKSVDFGQDCVQK
jgi:hypothetical protein